MEGQIRLRSIAPLLMIGILIGCNKPVEKTASLPPLQVETVAIGESASIALASTSFPATIAYDRESALSFRVGGTVTALPVRLGDRLSRGALVAAIDATGYQSALIRTQADVARLERATQRNAELLAAGAIAKAEVQDAQSSLAAARAAAASAHYDARSAQLHMPFPGVVLSKSADIGATLAPGQSLVTVADTRTPLVARTQLAPALAHDLHRGMRAVVLPADRAAVLSGHILRISATSDPRTGTVQVDVAIEGNPAIASGITGSVTFPNASAATQASAGQSIPAEALVDNADGNGHVYIVNARTMTAHLVPVLVLGIDGERVSISGLAPDARVITAGAGFVADGQRIVVQGQ